jgi:hypothetical protein
MVDSFLTYEFVAPEHEGDHRGVSNVELHGSVTKVVVSKPICERARLDGKPIEGSIWHAAFLFGVLPDPDCRVTWLRFGLELFDQSACQGGRLSDSAAAVALFPEQVYSETKYKRSLKISPNLKYTVVELGGSVEATKDAVMYEPEVIAFGRRTATPCWEFRATEKQRIIGDRETFALIQKTPDLETYCRVSISLEVTTTMGLIVPLKKRELPALDECFKLLSTDPLPV